MRPLILTLLFCCTAASYSAAQLPRIASNDNRQPVGEVRHGVLTLDLEITHGIWRPDADDAPGIEAVAIAQAGKTPTIPAPLIRVPRGTLVRTTLRNTLPQSMLVFGLHGSHAFADSLRMQPGETRTFELRAEQLGGYVYGTIQRFQIPNPDAPASGLDMTGMGAFIVDEGAPAHERVLVINMLIDTVKIPRQHGLTSIIATINGKAWPHSERPVHEVGDTVVWRVLNASLIPHPMHLHGFYFDVLSFGQDTGDSIFAPEQVRKVVTQRLLLFQSMTLRWIPERPGNWLFHCHLPIHTAMRGPIGQLKAALPAKVHVHDAIHGMANLMMGVTVSGTPKADDRTRRRLQLFVDGGDSLPGDLRPRFRYSLNEKANSSGAGPVIVLQQGEPVAISVVNRTKETTAVHWHGIELESFNDGVAGFGGHGTRITPLIQPGDSFVARMTPPRAGTFIYHTHVDERRQMPNLHGALVVVPRGHKLDEEHERVIVLGTPNDSGQIVFNGMRELDLPLAIGRSYRLRFIHIMTVRPAMYMALFDPRGQEAEWQLLAKDGADLPDAQRRTVAARQSMSNGETVDVLFTPRTAGTWRLETRANNNVVFGGMTITVR
jgi:FtsP/CotA-like multicopper oxidase with cupredoxin domain